MRAVAPGNLVVSLSTQRFLGEGHPWVRPDQYTRGLEGLRPGQSVTLMAQNGRALASALADPGAAICARVFHRRPGKTFDPAAALARAWEARAGLRGDLATDVWRLVHGEADFLPGFRIDRHGSWWVMVVFADCAAPHAEALCRALHGLAPEGRIVLKQHRDDLHRAPVACQEWTPGGLRPVAADTQVEVQELGCRFLVEPCAGLATGLYLDQRGTRAWLRQACAGRRVLNLFAYTGAFSVSLLAGGAAEAVDVDLSAPALARASANARRNGVAERHRTAQEDAQVFLHQDRSRYDLIICDPPTAAQGAGGWVLRRDYPPVLAAAWQRLAPGGLLLATCNTLHGKPFPLAETLAALGPGETVSPPPLGSDLPQLAGFPEGRPFRLELRRRG